ncbi:MAG: DUF4880 domain-containing protein [Opitutae bacterium]|nr:DUF4880 domain-containing protein [Opitutae bacterium]
MKDSSLEFPESSRIEQMAADWTLRMDRGLTPQEQDAYTEWLAEDPSHRKAMALYQWGWDEFDRLAGLQTTHRAHIDTDLLAPRSDVAPKAMPERKLKAWIAALPLAAALALTLYLSWPDTEPVGLEVKPALELMARIEQRILEDGSRVEINRGAEVEVAYTMEERRVYLKNGEANFNVAQDPNRSFIVDAAGVDIRAVSTIFNVKLSEEEVGILVTEGRVSLQTSNPVPSQIDPLSGYFLEEGQKAIVPLRSEMPGIGVTNLSQSEIEASTRWQPRLLDFDSAPLGDIIDEFNIRNPIQVELGDPSLEMVNLSSSFWSDNVEGFVRLMESSFGMKAEWQGSREIVLRAAQ